MRFVGMDVHEATTSICIRDRDGLTVDELVIPTTARAFRKLFPRRRSRWAVTFEEGPLAQWLYELLHARVGSVVVCNPRYNRLIRAGGKSDRIDAAKLAELLRLGALRPVTHSRKRHAITELVHHYEALVSDSSRIMHRIRAAYRHAGVPTSGMTVYSVRQRRVWLRKVRWPHTKARLKALYEQLDATTRLRDEARCGMVVEASRYESFALLRSLPYVGDVRAAQLVALVAIRNFPSRRHLWSYAGFAVVVHSSGDHAVSGAGDVRSRPVHARGLTRNYNPRLKRVLKDIALGVSLGRGPLRAIFDAHVGRGLSIPVARVAVARRVAAILFALLRDRVSFDPTLLRSSADSFPGTGSEQPRSLSPIEARA
ncbi:MAG TPA: transposase [Thermoanaerobaculia bacterium]|nr:transposase [Thermoanaerobaculia bacterium]